MAEDTAGWVDAAVEAVVRDLEGVWDFEEIRDLDTSRDLEAPPVAGSAVGPVGKESPAAAVRELPPTGRQPGARAGG